ncbi:MAG: hypothetical protein ACREDY_00900 [Bradyrhizobium sp.]
MDEVEIYLMRYRSIVIMAFKTGVIDAYDATKRLFNAGFRGQLLNCTWKETT